MTRLLCFLLGAALLAACGDGSVRKRNEPDPIPEPKCGDGVVNEGEQCDGSDLAGGTCASQGFDLGTLTCTNECQYSTLSCVKFCGDGKIGPGEECDGEVGPLACADFGYKACTDTCKVDALHCKTSTFSVAPPINFTAGGRSLLTDVAPEGYGELITAVPEFFRLQEHKYDISAGFTEGRKLSQMNDGLRPLDAIAADLDGDGHVDLATVNDDGTPWRHRFVPAGVDPAKPSAHFVFEPLLPASDAGTACPVQHRWLGAHALDANPGAELFVLACPGSTATETWDAVHLYPGGAMSSAPIELAHPLIQAAALGDFDGDGVVDLVLVEKDLDLVVRRGPAFEADPALSIGAVWPTSLAVADLDRDGDGDLVVASSGTVVVLENTGAGLAERQSFTGVPYELVVRDVDLDQTPDVAWVEDGKVELRRSLGAFTFKAYSVNTGAGIPLSLAFGDLEGDGDLDMAVGVRTSTTTTASTTHLFVNQVR